MSRKFISLLMVIGFCFGLSTISFARDCNNRNRSINERQTGQHQRIVRGVRSGELTARERARLGIEQREIRVEERAARADGEFTLAERRDIRQELNEANRHIYRAKHNRWDRN